MEKNNEPSTNSFVESLRIILAFVVQMKWILLVLIGVYIAYASGLEPQDILNWIKDIVSTLIGKGE